MFTLKNKFKNSAILKTYMLMLVPIIIVVISVIFAIIFLNSSYKEMIKKNYTTSLSVIYENVENNTSNIIKMVPTFLNNESFIDSTTKSEEYISDIDIINTTESLKDLRQKSTLIDSIFMLNRAQQTVFGTEGTHVLSHFFDSVYQYSNYPLNYWKYYQAPVTNAKILPPTIVTTVDGNKTVIPIVFTKIENHQLSGLLIVNIKISEMLMTLEKNKLTENSMFLIVNKSLKKCYNNNSVSILSFNEAFYENCILNRNAIFDTYTDNRRYMIVAYSPGSSVLGYAYAVMIPYTDINQTSMKFLLIMTVLGIIIFVIIMFLMKFSIKEIYKPIDQLTTNLEPSKTNNRYWDLNADDPITQLDTLIHNMQQDNQQLRQNINAAKSIKIEQDLITLLNQNEHYAEDASEILLKDTLKNFKYNYFCSIVITLSLSNNFYEEYSATEYNSINYGIRTIILSMFEDHFRAYSIPCQLTDSVYILLNPENDSCENKINDILQQIKTIFIADKKYVEIKINCGGIYTGISGLRKSHKNAIQNITEKSNRRAQLNIVPIKSHTSTPFHFSEKEQIHLIDFLLSGNTEASLAYIKETVLSNLQNNISENALIDLYSAILRCLVNTIHMKHSDITIDEDMLYTLSADSSNDFFDKTNQLLHIMKEGAKNNDKVDINTIILYIDLHFTEDNCCIDTIANLFNADSKYLSKKFKDVTGTKFTDYIAEKRISLAKELLSQGKQISDICEAVGYPVKSTFIRAFKKIEGLSPSEYINSVK